MKHAGQLHIYTTVLRERLVCKVYEDVVSVYTAFDYKLQHGSTKLAQVVVRWWV